jgi:dolichol-phosphate mannosyltransferase
MTGILMFSHIPLRMATIFGVMTSLVSFFLAFYVVISWLIKPFDVPGYLSTFLTITLLGGVQLIAIGIIGHYLGYLIDNNRRWPIAFITEATEENEE